MGRGGNTETISGGVTRRSRMRQVASGWRKRLVASARRPFAARRASGVPQGARIQTKITKDSNLISNLFLPEDANAQEQLFEDPAAALASRLHNDWRSSRKFQDGTYEPRIKITQDKSWIERNGTNEVDIANTDFQDLPSDWQEENAAAAEVALESLIQTDDREEAASLIHDEWLKRNGEWAEEEQKLPYEQLSEEEKEKDRKQFDLAQSLLSAQQQTLQKIINGEKKAESLASSQVASRLHDDWRETRRLQDGAYEPRIKETKDKAWIQENGTNQVDIANTNFQDLPNDWQEENRAAAEAAIAAVQEANNIEEAASIAHDEWLKRNGEWAEEGQKLPYEQLSEEEKEKDRSQVRAAAEAMPNMRIARVQRDHAGRPSSGPWREGTIVKRRKRSDKILNQELSADRVQIAEAGVKYAGLFIKEARSIADYTRKEMKRSSKSADSILQDIKENRENYEGKISGLTTNDPHSGASWGMVMNAAHDFVKADPHDRNSVAEQSAKQYLASEERELRRMHIRQGLAAKVAEKLFPQLNQ